MSAYHVGVLKKELIEYLQVKGGDLYIDATIGGGTHTFEILKRGGRVLGIDQDKEAIDYVRSQSQREKGKVQIGKNLILVKSNFTHIKKIAHEYGFASVSGIIFDLGVSSHQLEEGKRGFSFLKEGKLDMRMDKETNVNATDLINNLDKRRLNEIFQTYGQEKFSLAIAGAICSARQIKPIQMTTELAEIAAEVYRKNRIYDTKIHPATRIFQAIRIVINSELLNLESTLPQTIELLKDNGRLAIISFHSLEDGTVKRFFKREPKLKVITKKPIGPQVEELKENPRSRSAKLRVAEKI